jgi:hypothetical protein
VIFIDASHQYLQTKNECKIWLPRIAPGGFLLLHDASQFAASYDAHGSGGVATALAEFFEETRLSGMVIENRQAWYPGVPTTFLDPCGLGIIQGRSRRLPLFAAPRRRPMRLTAASSPILASANRDCGPSARDGLSVRTGLIKRAATSLGSVASLR